MLVILIAGTPGSGKTTFITNLKALFDKSSLSSEVVNISSLVKENKLYDNYDETFDTYIIDEKVVRKFVKKHVAKLKVDVCILETHSAYTIPQDFPDIVVVLRCRTDVLYDRLKKREYSGTKISENVECEIMNVVLEECYERFAESQIVQLQSDDERDLKENLEKISKLYPLNEAISPVL